MMYVRIPYCAPGSEMQNPAKLAAIESAIIKAYAARSPGVRTGIHTATMAPSRDPGDWDWSFLDFTVGLCKQYGLKILLELAYGGVEGDCESDCWDSTNEFEPVSTDHTDLASFYVATVQRFDEEYEWNLRNGDVIFTLWNEPDRTAFGATADGEFSSDCIDFFNTATIALKTAYPKMLLAAPSLSLIDAPTNGRLSRLQNTRITLAPTSILFGVWPITWTSSFTMDWMERFPWEASPSSA